MDKYNLGDVCFCWDGGGYELFKGEFFERFRVNSSEGMEEIKFQGCFQALEPYSKYEKITENYSYELFNVENQQLLIYHWSKCRFGFSVWPQRINSDEVNTCYFDPKMKNDVPMKTDWFFGLSGLHRALLQKHAPILHASYIDFDGQAVLFTAPSQTGKSTQANLWEKYAGAEIINGDRVLLRKRNNIWHAYGYPCCGSSKICVNRTLPIRAIVILRQDNENYIKQLSVSEKIRSLGTGIEVYRWDLTEVELSLELAEDIISQVPVFQLNCRADENAVHKLRKYLEKMK